MTSPCHKKIHHSSSLTDQTRHRYPWICSLRSREVSPQHYCAVTLFSRPPAPTVLVGPAHCTFLCKSSRDEVDNCCCGGANDCSDDIPRCGNLPKVVEMTGIIPGPCDYFFASRNSHQSIHIQPENQEIVCPIKKEVNQGSRVTSRNTPRL